MTQPFPQDIHRPRYHFLPAANWMNDPNGVIHWRGQYHLFFQYNPDGAYHANMHWGHAVSDDLVQWRELPVAIAPTPVSPDEGGIFSGCMVVHDGAPVAVYTGVNDDYSQQVQCLATGNGDLTEWEKFAGNPVLADVPAHLGQTRDFRDPFVWREGETWLMTLSAHIVGVGGAALLYRSPNLVDWDYAGPLYVGERTRSGRNFECANFFPLGDKWVMLLSVMLDAAPATTLYLVGRREGDRFIPEREGVYDAGYSYASLTHFDDDGIPLIYSWIREGRSVERQKEAGWSGVQAIPRVLSLDDQNRLVSQPVPALESLRHSHQAFSASELDESGLALPGFALDIEAEFQPDNGGLCGLELAAGGEKLAIQFDSLGQTLCVYRQYRRDYPELDDAPQGIPHPLDPGERLQLRVLVDGSVIEVIANGRSRVTSRFYPAAAADPRLRAIAPAALTGLDIWQMSAIG